MILLLLESSDMGLPNYKKLFSANWQTCKLPVWIHGQSFIASCSLHGCLNPFHPKSLVSYNYQKHEMLLIIYKAQYWPQDSGTYC